MFIPSVDPKSIIWCLGRTKSRNSAIILVAFVEGISVLENKYRAPGDH